MKIECGRDIGKMMDKAIRKKMLKELDAKPRAMTIPEINEMYSKTLIDYKYSELCKDVLIKENRGLILYLNAWYELLKWIVKVATQIIYIALFIVLAPIAIYLIKKQEGK